MRRSGVRFISPAPIQQRKPRYQYGSGVFCFPSDVRADVSKFRECHPAPDKRKAPSWGFGRGLVCQPGGCMNGIRALAAAMRRRSGRASWRIALSSHCRGSAVSGRPCIRRGLLRLPSGLPAPSLRPPQPVELDCFSIPDFFCEWEAVGCRQFEGCKV